MNKRVLLFEAMDVINDLVNGVPSECVDTAVDAAEALLRRYKNTGGTLTYELANDSDSVRSDVRIREDRR